MLGESALEKRYAEFIEHHKCCRTALTRKLPVRIECYCWCHDVVGWQQIDILMNHFAKWMRIEGYTL